MNADGHRVPTRDVTKGRAWCGLWADGSLGFLVSPHVPFSSLTDEQKQSIEGTGRHFYPSDFFRVEVTIKAVRNRKGNYIVKRNKKHK